MKVIDLYNKIANGEEVPKKIKYDNQVFEYREEMLDYYCFDYDLNLMGYQKILNDEVEIIEEEKKIPEKIDMFDYFTGYDFSGTDKDLLKHLETNFETINKSINEIIDCLKIKGDK